MNLLKGSSRFIPYATGVYVDYFVCVSWFVSRSDFQFVENAPSDWAWQSGKKWREAPRAHVSVG